MKQNNIFKQTISYIASHFLIRNIIFATTIIISLVFVINITLGIFTRHGQRLIVPDLEGLSVTQAQDSVKENDLKIIVIDSIFIKGQTPGAILDQNPMPRSTVKQGRKIFVVINAENPRQALIPYVVGYSLRQAKNMIENSGFGIEKIVYRTDDATNNVLGQSYKGQNINKAGQLKATLGTNVTLVVGRNSKSPLPQVPKLVGLTLGEAKSRLWEVGLNVGELREDQTIEEGFENRARVYKQVPNQLSRSDFGASVRLYITDDTKKVKSGEKQSDAEAREFVELDSVVVEEHEDSIANRSMEELMQ